MGESVKVTVQRESLDGIAAQRVINARARLRLKRGAGARDGGGVWTWASGHFPVVSRGMLL